MEKPVCAVCGGRAERALPLREVLTLPIREMGGERRVQALGERLEAAVCDECLRRYMEEIRCPRAAIWRAAALFGGITALGALMVFGLLPLGMDLRLPGAAALIMGPLGLAQRLLQIRARRAEALAAQGDGEGRYAHELLSRALPSKEGENDLSYVPLWGPAAGMDAQQLARRYRLLPQIARQLTEQRQADQAQEGGFEA